MHYGVQPDIITMAKGITSSYFPLSVTAVKREIFETFKEGDEYSFLRHVNTFGGHPAACAVALKNIEIIENEELIDRSKQLGEQLSSEMAELIEHPHVGDIRSKGLLMGIELVEDKITKEPAKEEMLNSVINHCKDKGLLIKKNGLSIAGFNNILTISPPLSLTDNDFVFLVETFKDAFTKI